MRSNRYKYSPYRDGKLIYLVEDVDAMDLDKKLPSYLMSFQISNPEVIISVWGMVSGPWIRRGRLPFGYSCSAPEFLPVHVFETGFCLDSFECEA